MNPQAPIVSQASPEIFPVTQSVQSPQTPPPPQKAKDNHWLTILAMAVFVVLTLGVVAFLYYQNQALKSMLANLQTPVAVASPTPTATTDPTANWKTYTDPTKSFSFKYPNDWGTLDLGGPFMVAPLANIEMISKTKNQPYYGISSGKQSVLVVQAITGVDNSIKNDTDVSNQYWSVIKSTINVGNVVTAKYLSTCIKNTPNGYMKGDISIQVNIPSGNDTLIEISLGDQTYSQIFDQILSTFKFTEATPSASPSSSPISSSIPSPLPY